MVESNTIYAPKTQLWMPGISTNYVSTPDHVDFDMGDFCLILSIKNTSGPVYDYGITKYSGAVATDRAFTFEQRNSSGNKTLALVTSSTGTTWPESNLAASQSFPSSLLNYSIAVTADMGNIVRFWISYDDITWIKLGDDRVFTVSSMTFGNASINIGAYQNGLGSYLGGIKKAEIYSGIGDNSQPGLGTLVAEADFSKPWTNNKYRDKTGKIWTINGSSWAWEYQDDPGDRYDNPDIIYGGDATSLIPDTVGNATSSIRPTHIYEGDVI